MTAKTSSGSAHVSINYDPLRSTFFTRIEKAPNTIPLPLEPDPDSHTGYGLKGNVPRGPPRPNRDISILQGKEDDLIVENWGSGQAMDALLLLLEGTEHMPSAK